MPDLSSLTDRERETLHMLVRGHDAKSIASALDLSVHTINERLRSARRKLGASSSREAARLVATAEAPEIFGYEKTGVVASPRNGQRSVGRHVWLPFLVAGAPSMMIAIAALILSTRNAAHPVPLAPRVVRTMPSKNAIIAPGPFTLSVTYDRPMRAEAYSFVQLFAGSYPRCESRPIQSRDGHTFALRCVAAPAHGYRIGFNGPRYMHFQSIDGTPATPFVLNFRSR